MVSKNAITELQTSILQQLHGRETFTRQDLYNAFTTTGPALNTRTFAWRIHELKAKKIIRAVSRSEFSLVYKPLYTPPIDKKLKDLYTLLDKNFPLLRKTIWSTQWVSDFMLHIPGRYFTIIEAEKGSLESIFFFLKDHKYKEVYINPSQKEIDLYVAESSRAIILKPLISQSPLQKQKKFTPPALEKILLDIFAERDVFTAFQGHELTIIFNNACSQYQVNFSTLMAYAKRRGKAEALAAFLSQKTDVPYSLP